MGGSRGMLIMLSCQTECQNAQDTRVSCAIVRPMSQAGDIWGMFAAITDCHLAPDCQSLARPHSFPHQHQDHQGWLWLPLVISCHVIILHISHLWQLFLLVREDEKKALSLSSATTNTKITTDRLWAESLEMEMYSEFEGIVQSPPLFAKCSVLLAGFLEGVIQSNVGKIHQQNTCNSFLNLVSATISTATLINWHLIIPGYLDIQERENRTWCKVMVSARVK